MKNSSPFYKTGTSRSPFNKHKPGHIQPTHGETYGDFHKRTSGGATNHWGGKETNKELLNQQYSDSSSTFVRNPKHLNLKPTELKDARNKEKSNKKLSFLKPNEGENKSEYTSRVLGNPGLVRSNETYTGGKWTKNN